MTKTHSVTIVTPPSPNIMLIHAWILTSYGHTYVNATVEYTTLLVSPPELRCMSQNPCRNGATCVETGAIPLCECTDEYTGVSCENSELVLHLQFLCHKYVVPFSFRSFFLFSYTCSYIIIQVRTWIHDVVLILHCVSRVTVCKQERVLERRNLWRQRAGAALQLCTWIHRHQLRKQSVKQLTLAA